MFNIWRHLTSDLKCSHYYWVSEKGKCWDILADDITHNHIAAMENKGLKLCCKKNWLLKIQTHWNSICVNQWFSYSLYRSIPEFCCPSIHIDYYCFIPLIPGQVKQNFSGFHFRRCASFWVIMEGCVLCTSSNCEK